ncbi:apolipoprotein N-acyltransferase [Micromonospora sp. HM5-17]|nr:apolipoprotein N-acyltransferase [Micromonospora sp. HM5-17]ROT29843.1 apolipoprotein N-acyltransferase [Micromonospora sp. HM5-17]
MMETAGAAVTEGDGPRGEPGGARRRAVGRPLPRAAALLAAPAAGVALLLAFPPYGWWWSAPLGVLLFTLAVHRRRLRAGFGLGALAGLAFFAPMLTWTNLHTGKLPWLLLSGLQAGYLGLLGAAVAVTSALVDRARWSWPLVTGVLWVAQEALRDRTPFGGFPWGRLAFSQGDSPLLRLAALGGAPLVTFGVAFVGGLLTVAVWRPWRRVTVAGGGRAVALVAGAVAVVAAGLLVPVGVGSGAGTVTVAIVQGNVPRLGLDFNAQRQAVLNNHADATIALARRVAAGAAPRPDLVVWPENASDIDPTREPRAAARISEAADAVGAPILVGAVLLGPGEGQVRNAGLVWMPGSGWDSDQVYVKRHPVPFAEYVPLRSIARRVSKEVDRVRNDFVAGTEPGVLRVGGVSLGDVICFEVAYDSVVRDTVTGGAQLLAVQTNNATFNEAEALQQLAMVRLRAVEHGREGLMASTVGVSGFVGADGRVTGATGFNTQEVVTREMHLGDARTVATRVGVWPEVALVAVAVAALVTAVVLRRRPLPGDGTATAGDPADAEER